MDSEAFFPLSQRYTRWESGKKASDTKLKRQVALKILPEAFSADPERLARFQREVKVVAMSPGHRLGRGVA